MGNSMWKNVLPPFLLLCSLTSVFARPQFVFLIPNGFRGGDPMAGIGCIYIGHTNCIPGSPRNQFGLDFQAAGYEWTVDLCQTDSDGDGLTNGEELGDPCCTWKVGDDSMLPSTGLSHPGVTDNTTDAPQPSCSDPPSTVHATPEEDDSGMHGTPGEEEELYPDIEDWIWECFPSESTVTLADGSLKPMHALQVGDMVQVGAGEFSKVFMFTHRLSQTLRPFTVLTTSRANVSLTPGHFLYVNDGLVAAGQARVGDLVELQDGSKDMIVNVHTELKRGLYNPQTLHGDIVVNGVRASTYTKAVAPGAAHPLLTPLRLVFRYTGWSTSVVESGIEGLV